MFKHVFDDLSYNTSEGSNTLIVQHPLIPSDPYIDSMLSAPPPWSLHIDRPSSTPQTVGYSAFTTLCQLSQEVKSDN